MPHCGEWCTLPCYQVRGVPRCKPHPITGIKFFDHLPIKVRDLSICKIFNVQWTWLLLNPFYFTHEYFSATPHQLPTQLKQRLTLLWLRIRKGRERTVSRLLLYCNITWYYLTMTLFKLYCCDAYCIIVDWTYKNLRISVLLYLLRCCNKPPYSTKDHSTPLYPYHLQFCLFPAVYLFPYCPDWPLISNMAWDH